MAPAAAAEPPQHAFSAACAAVVAPLSATAGTLGQGLCGSHRARERCGCAGSRSVDTPPTVPSPARSQPRPSPPSDLHSSMPSAPPKTACRPVAPRARAPGCTQLDAGGPARSPVFCGDFLHHLDLEVTLGHQLLQPRILDLKLLQAAHVVRLKPAETLAPDVDRLLAGPVPLGNRRYRFAIRLAEDRHHLVFRKTRFAHCSLRIGSQSLNLSMVRKSGSRSQRRRSSPRAGGTPEPPSGSPRVQR